MAHELKLLESGTLVAYFQVSYNKVGSIAVINSANDVSLEVKVGGAYTPVIKGGIAVVLSTAGDMPLGIYAPGLYKVSAAAMGASEEVWFYQD